MSDLNDIAKRLINSHFEAINIEPHGAKISRAYVYRKDDVIILHIVLRRSGNVTFKEEDFHKKLESAFDSKIKYHMSYDGERGGISDPPMNAIKFFDAEYPPLPNAPNKTYP